MISSLLKNGILKNNRKKFGKIRPDTILAHKEKKRNKSINIYAAERTNEPPSNDWLSSKRSKTLLKNFEDFRNIHPYTLKLSPKDKKLMEERCKADQDFHYYRMKQEKHMILGFKKNVDDCRNELETMPFKLRQEILKNKPFNKGILPAIQVPVNMYYEQIMRIFPDEMTKRIQLSLTLGKIANDKLVGGD